MSTGQRDGASLDPDQYAEVMYEDLVVQPEQTLRPVAAFLELPFAQEMLTYYEGKVQSKPGRSAKSAWLPPTPGLRNWRTQMKPRDVELFEAIAGDLLSALGYERGFSTISPAIAALAEGYRSWWEAGPKRRRKATVDQKLGSPARH